MEPRFDFYEFRIYTRRVMWGVIFFGSIIFVGGIKFSGIDLERLRGSSLIFKPGEHICVKKGHLSGRQPESEIVEICIEWIDLKDTTGNTHHLNPESIKISIGPQGEIAILEKRKINIPLVGAIVYLLSVIFIGNFIQTKLISRRRNILKKNGESNVSI